MVLFSAACQHAADTSREPPNAEFLFAAGDSTYWVRSSATGLRVRSAPILLTQVDGRFFEVFIAEDGVDYDDAAFAVSRVYSRDVTHGDSLSLFDDGTVMREAAAWKRRHPRAAPIDPEREDVPGDPRTVVSEEIEILDVHGPWVTFNHLLDVDLADREPHRHVGKRYVIDVRTGARATLSMLFGEAEARRLIDEGLRSYQQLTDSIRQTGDDRAELARESLESFKFDSSSFGLTDIARTPAVAFMVPGTGSDGEALALNLPAIAAAAPPWWRSVQLTLPTWAADSSLVRWARAGYDVVARPNADGESLALSLVPSPARAVAEWPIATVPAPAYQLVPLDAPAVATSLRDALARAFDASSTLDGVTTATTRRPPPAKPAAAPVRFRLTNHD